MGVDDRLMPLPPLAEFLIDLAAVSSDDLDVPDAARLGLASIRIEMPIEIEIDDTTTAIRATPPTQWTRTTVMPVLHRLMVHIETAPEP